MRGRAALAALPLVLLLAGCLSPATAPPPAGAGAAAFTLRDLPDGLGGEPQVAAAPDGTLYVAAPGWNGDHFTSRLWRERGGNLTRLADVYPESASGDAGIAVGPDGTLWVVTLAINDPVTGFGRASCDAVSVSRDGGKTFATNPLACPSPPSYWDRPWVAAGSQFAYVLAWHPQNGFLVPGLTRSTDGTAWVGLASLETPFPNNWHGPLAVDGDHLWVPYVDNYQLLGGTPAQLGSFGYGPVVADADPLGAQWTRTMAAHDTLIGGFPVLAMDGGKGLVAWTTPATKDLKGRLALHAATFDGAAWTPFTVDGNGTNMFAWAAQGHGHRAVAWLHADSDAYPNAVNASTPWSLKLWLDGRTWTVDPLVHRGPSCLVLLSPMPCQPDTRRMLDFLSVALLPDGRVAVAYTTDLRPGLPAKANVGQLRLAVGPTS